MPTYQYACTEPACGNRFELVQSFTDASLTECPVCTGTVRKVYGSVGVVFKGSGFYRNDSRASGESKSESSNGSKSESKSKSESASESSATSGSKSESSSSKSDSSSTKSDSTSTSSSSSKAAASA